MADKYYGLSTVRRVEGDSKQQTVISCNENDPPQDPKAFDRYINFAAIVNFAICIQAGWEVSSILLGMGLLNGGPVSLIYGSIIAGIGGVAIALSLGEMASIDPNVGAQYRWSALFATQRQEFWGLIQGWITVFAWVAGVASGLIGTANIIQALMVLWNPTYIVQGWHTALFMWSLVFAALFCNLYLRHILNTLEILGGVCHVLFFVAIVAILTILADRNSPEFVFKTLVWEVSGWNNPGISFNIGLLPVLLPLIGADSVLHMIDETKEPHKRVPKAMISSTIFNAILMLAFQIVLMFSIGDYEAVATSQLPILTIYYQVTKSKAAATIMMVAHGSIGVVATFNSTASASRLIWAFARDNGLPFSSFFSRVHPRLQIPLPAVGLVIVICCSLSLICIGSTVAFNAITSLTTLSLSLSYVLPLYHLLVRKITGNHPRYGPFKLGRWGIPVNIFALIFCIYTIIWVAFPIMYPVDAENMNYAGPISLLVISGALIDWFTSGKTRFSVPTRAPTYNIELDDHNETTKGSD